MTTVTNAHLLKSVAHVVNGVVLLLYRHTKVDEGEEEDREKEEEEEEEERKRIRRKR